jgi:hypothetical protein
MKQTFIFLVAVTLLFLTACGGGDDNGKSEQTISFGPLAPHNLSERSFELDAKASSNLQVSFKSSDLSVATVNGKTVTLLKKGTTTITASQSGNDTYFEAPNVPRALVVNEDNDPDKQTQTITFNLTVVEWKSSQGSLTLEATASSGLPVSFSSNLSYVVISGNILSLEYTGAHYNENVIITASQAGNNEYNAAATVSRVLHVSHED